MSEDNVRGPVMLAATTMLRPPPTRIAKLGDNLVLPRSVSLKSLAGGSVGFLLGLIIYFLFFVPTVGFSFEIMLIVLAGITASGVGIVNWSPLKGENWSTWATLRVGAASRGRVRIDGEEVRAYIGIASLPYSAAGKVEVLSAAEEVLPGSVDARGSSLSSTQIRQMRSTGFPGDNPSYR
jgi:hypothetical protein